MAAEKQFEKQVERFLHGKGIYSAGTPRQSMKHMTNGWYTKIWGGGYQKSGIPDIICCVNGIFISIELKASNGHPSDIQKLNTKRINESRGIGIILYPEGFEDFKGLIREVLECRYHTQELTRIIDAHRSTGCIILTN